ncbi:hypothetical protein L2E82_10001 [Cichorium intybus]|uniref:Uncharacterized protein n=1 Tax=Cichorium intybus TaxID=13427 RepID=A0ACB9GA61_CICIN|nr:hypothetical protein L2E82_10001 [Cichorium intybus]
MDLNGKQKEADEAEVEQRMQEDGSSTGLKTAKLHAIKITATSSRKGIPRYSVIRESDCCIVLSTFFQVCCDCSFKFVLIRGDVAGAILASR